MLAAVSLTAACTSPRPVEPGDSAATEEPPPATLDEAIAGAKRARAEADALKPPAYAGPRDPESLSLFMNTPFKEWTAKKNLAALKATRAYANAARLAPPETQLELRLGFAEMWLDYADEFVSTGEGAIPDVWRRHPSIVASYRDSLSDTTRPQIDVARVALEQCVATAKQYAIDSPTAARCDERLAELDRAAAAAKTFPYRPRPFQATRQPSPCVFHGTLHGLGMRLFANESGPDALAQLDRADVEVQLAPVAGARPHARVLWPIQTEGYLDQYPFETTRRVDAVSNHVWLPAGAAVNVYAPRGTNATIAVDFAPPGGAQHSPAAFSREVACADLALRGPLRAGGTKPSRDDLVLHTGKVELYDQPCGKIVASVMARGDAVTPVEYRGDWTRILVKQPFHADAWVESSVLRERTGKSIGIVGLRAVDQGHVTHMATDPIALRLSPDQGRDADANANASEAATLQLAPGAGFELGATHGAFVEVRPSGVRRADGAPYYALSSDIDAKTVLVR